MLFNGGHTFFACSPAYTHQLGRTPGDGDPLWAELSRSAPPWDGRARKKIDRRKRGGGTMRELVCFSLDCFHIAFSQCVYAAFSRRATKMFPARHFFLSSSSLSLLACTDALSMALCQPTSVKAPRIMFLSFLITEDVLELCGVWWKNANIPPFFFFLCAHSLTKTTLLRAVVFAKRPAATTSTSSEPFCYRLRASLTSNALLGAFLPFWFVVLPTFSAFSGGCNLRNDWLINFLFIYTLQAVLFIIAEKYLNAAIQLWKIKAKFKN